MIFNTAKYSSFSSWEPVGSQGCSSRELSDIVGNSPYAKPIHYSSSYPMYTFNVDKFGNLAPDENPNKNTETIETKIIETKEVVPPIFKIAAIGIIGYLIYKFVK